MTRLSIFLAVLALAATAASPIRAYAADTTKHEVDRANNAATDTGSKTPVVNPRPGAGAMTGSHSDTTSVPSTAAPPTNQPSAPVGH